MFSHVMVGANDIEASKTFYDAVLGAIGIGPGNKDPLGRVFYSAPTGNFGISKPINGEPATFANGGTIGFACDSAEMVDAMHAAGVAAGGSSCEDPPGVRAAGTPMAMYLCYLRDPTGNKICGFHFVGA